MSSFAKLVCHLSSNTWLYNNDFSRPYLTKNNNNTFNEILLLNTQILPKLKIVC